MKLSVSSLRRSLLLTAFTLITVTAASAASPFEGRVHMEVTTSKNDKKMGMDYSMKDGKLRMDVQAPPDRNGGRSAGMGGIIFDMQAHEMIMLMDMNGRKMFMRRAIPQPTVAQTSQMREGHHMDAPVATGRTEMIAGYKATEYTMKSDNGEIIDLWLAKGSGPFMSMSGGNPMGGRGTPPAGWENFARDGNAFPMRVVTHNRSGAEATRMEVTSVEKVSLPDSAFSTDGYTEFSIPGLGGH